MNKNQKLILAGILLLATILRVIVINSRNIQYDDAFSFFLAKQTLPSIISGTAADTMPPLFYFLLHFWLLISKEIWVLRFFSVLMSLGALAFLFLFIRKAVNPAAGLWAAFFAAISPLQIYHAQDIRMYALLAFCGMAYLYFLFSAWEYHKRHERRLWNWVGLVGFGVGSMYTHNLAIFWIVSPLVFFILQRDWKFLWKLLTSLLVIGVFSSFWMVMVPGQIQKIQTAFWTPRPGLVEVIQAIMLLTYHLPAQSEIYFFLGAVISIEIFFLVIIRGIKQIQDERNFILLFVMVFMPPFLLFITSYLIRPVFVIRGFLPAQLVFLGLAGAVAAIDWKKKIGVVIALLIAINSLLSLPFLYSYNKFPRSPFREASQIIETKIDEGYFVVHDNKLSYFPTSYYLSPPEQVFIMDTPGTANDTFALKSQEAMGVFPEENIETGVGGKEKILFVVFTEAIQEYERKQQNHPIIKWLKANYLLTNEDVIGDLRLMYFENAVP